MGLWDLKQAAFLGAAALVALPAVLIGQQESKAIPFNNSATEVAQFPSVSEGREADAYVTPVDGIVSITLVNSSPSVISYMVPGESRFEEISPNEEVNFSTATLPRFIGFRQLDGGLTYAQVSSVSDSGDRATIDLQHLNPSVFYSNPDLITRSIVISETGGIYID